MSDALLDLSSRLEKATGPDRGIDYILANWWGGGRDVPSYTASLDAALALVERLLPGWFLTLDRYIVTDDPKQRGCWRVWLKRVHDDDALPNAYIRKAFGRGDTPALALLSALLKALLAQGQKQ